ncbi:hypothetical protein FGO68_gene13113 [Halteria grandinella]|uniref:Uncharacterized protein n=1 Tax=Halteria grandinella TaxID=5974 RepID=A0A8J8NHK2_HALGN|nr:hypothetical protein FGO68_gene13113 [Halteria grandinella]
MIHIGGGTNTQDGAAGLRQRATGVTTQSSAPHTTTSDSKMQSVNDTFQQQQRTQNDHTAVVSGGGSLINKINYTNVVVGVNQSGLNISHDHINKNQANKHHEGVKRPNTTTKINPQNK